MKKIAVKKNILLISIFISALLLTALFIPRALTPHNLTILLRQASYLGIFSTGLTFIVITGGIDLSAGSLVAVGGGLCSLLYFHYFLPEPLAIILTILSVTVFGTFNGIIITLLKIKPVLATLGSMIVFSNIYMLISRSYFNVDTSDFIDSIYWGYWGGLPIPFIIYIFLLLIASFLLNFTYFGRYLYAIGDNPEAMKLMGIKVGYFKILAYALGGFFCGFAGIMMLSRSPQSTTSGLNLTVLFDALITLRMGGVSFNGAKGKISDVFLGVFLMILFTNFMTYFKIEIHMQSIIKGLLFLIMVTFENQWHKKESVEEGSI